MVGDANEDGFQVVIGVDGMAGEDIDKELVVRDDAAAGPVVLPSFVEAFIL